MKNAYTQYKGVRGTLALGKYYLKYSLLATYNLTRLCAYVLQTNKDSVVIDCGANVGRVSRILALRGATVHAFEPNPYAFAKLKKRFEHNPSVHCYQQAVWTKQSTLKLYLHHDSNNNNKYSEVSSVLKEKENVSTKKSVSVPTINLDAFIRSLDTRVAILKIDIEGAECAVVKHLITQNTYTLVDRILVEVHDHKIPSLKQPTQEIRDLIQEKNISNIDLNWY